LFQPFHPTVEDVYDANVATDRGTVENLRFYDTEGLDPTNTKNLTDGVPRHLLAVADGVVIVYSIDDENSFQIAEVLRKEAEKHKEKKEVRFFFNLETYSHLHLELFVNFYWGKVIQLEVCPQMMSFISLPYGGGGQGFCDDSM